MVVGVPIDIDRLRLVAALCHRVDDADVELFGRHGRLLVSYRRSDATIDPCAFRQHVIAAGHGHSASLRSIEVVRFVGARRDLGGGISERRRADGIERHIATLLPPADAVVLADLPDCPATCGSACAPTTSSAPRSSCSPRRIPRSITTSTRLR